MTTHEVWYRGRIVGNFDDAEKTYSKICDYSLGHVFRHPKYRQSVGVSKGLITHLLKTYGEIKWFKWQILNLPGEEDFDSIIEFSKFMENKQEVFFGKKNPNAKHADQQYILSLNFFTRKYHGQGVLTK